MRRVRRLMSVPLASPWATLPRAIDAHCHLHDPRLQAHVGAVIQRAVQANLTHVATCACFEEDWLALQRLISANNEGGAHENIDATLVANASSAAGRLKIVPSFGIHPWWASSKSPGYLDALRATLMKYPDALLGEIGLCKSARGKQIDAAVQEQVFSEQLRLAAEMQRPCVLHCVGAYGKLLEALQSEQKQSGLLPPAVILHSYSGAVEMVSAFLAVELKSRGATKIYFSLNAKQLASYSSTSDGSNQGNQVKLAKAEAVCMKVPLDSLLLETDSPDQAPTSAQVSQVFNDSQLEVVMANQGLNEPAVVQLALVKAAAIRQLSVEELAEAVYENTRRAFRIRVD